jgi:hypothetical protein
MSQGPGRMAVVIGARDRACTFGQRRLPVRADLAPPRVRSRRADCPGAECPTMSRAVASTRAIVRRGRG